MVQYERLKNSFYLWKHLFQIGFAHARRQATYEQPGYMWYLLDNRENVLLCGLKKNEPGRV